MILECSVDRCGIFEASQMHVAWQECIYPQVYGAIIPSYHRCHSPIFHMYMTLIQVNDLEKKVMILEY